MDRRTGRWQAKISIEGRLTYLGTYDTEREAAVAYNEEAIRQFGDYANLNEF